ncbi:hypothetical protein GIB67_043084, partial [Kingdonia uniflora]
DTGISGGVDKGTSLAWMFCGNQLFVWSYFSPSASKKCVILHFPPSIEDASTTSNSSNVWMICVVNWNSLSRDTRHQNSVGIVMCNKKSKAVIYWRDIFSEGGVSPVLSLTSDEFERTSSPSSGNTPPNSQPRRSRLGTSNLVEESRFNSLIASAIPGTRHVCVALACGSNGELWRFRCSASGIYREKISQAFNILSSQSSDGGHPTVDKGYPRSLIWRFQVLPPGESHRQFFVLTDHEIQCFMMHLDSNMKVTKLWSHEIVGADSDSGIKKDLAGQKRIWPLDMQVDDRGKELTILVATFCKDRVSSSSYTQYSLLTMQYKSGFNVSSDNIDQIRERVLEKKAPIQVIIPKARVEDEDSLFSMRLRVGGKPSGSTIIVSGDGTATVSHYWRNSTRLYQFDLPWDAGKVLDASVFPSTEDNEEGAWVVLTEKAGVWAIPEKAVLLGGVEPPERSLSRKGSSNEGASEEERRNTIFGGNIAPRRASSEASWDAGDRQRAVLTGVARRTAQDEESEALLGRHFQNFLLSGQVDDSLEKLRKSGAFEKDDETNIFVRTSKSIVDTLAKHWTSTRGAEIVAMAVMSSQLLDKQQKHQRFLQFLALSKCHEELRSRQSMNHFLLSSVLAVYILGLLYIIFISQGAVFASLLRKCFKRIGDSLQTIMEHGEKLAGMIQLRELQSTLSQNDWKQSNNLYAGSSDEKAGSLWDLIQLVGEKARRTTVLLMDRDNAEVFYSKVSDLEEVFFCLSHQLQLIIGEDMPLVVQVQRVCELSNACTTLIRAAIHYRTEHNTWYPTPEGLTHWSCLPVVRNGLWCVASLMIHLLKETGLEAKTNLHNYLEGLTDVLLETYTGSITAKVERGEEQTGLLDEYWKRRDALLDSLYQNVRSSAEDKYQREGTEEPKEVILENFYSPLLAIARRHEGYQILWNICCDLNDTTLLRNFMHESVGPRGGFSYFVFKQLYENHEITKLLRLGEEFQEELSIFVKEHKDLLWLHEIFLNRFSSASDTLHALALSQNDTSALASEESFNPESTKSEPSLAERRRLLNLSKIAAMAARDIEFEIKAKRIEADLKILKLQEEIISLIPDNEEKTDIGQQLLPPWELIELCLKNNTPKLSLRAFDVFAWTSSSFRTSNKSLLKECWKNAADQDEWGKLYQSSIEEGWSDEEILQALRETVLFAASKRCYGSEAETYESGFDEVLPLRQEEVQVSVVKDGVSSVEGILMQHKSFPDAGKMMLTAIMLGKVGAENTHEEIVSMPME